jgi:hypothetical protein
LESLPHLKGDMASGAMDSPIVVVLKIGNTLIPYTWILRVIHPQDVHNNMIDDSVWPSV